MRGSMVGCHSSWVGSRWKFGEGAGPSAGLVAFGMGLGRTFGHVLARYELAAQQLADRRFRDLVHEDVPARQLVTRQAARPAMGIERRFVGCCRSA